MSLLSQKKSNDENNANSNIVTSDSKNSKKRPLTKAPLKKVRSKH